MLTVLTYTVRVIHTGHNWWTICWYFLLFGSTFCPLPLSLRYLALYAYKPQKADELELRKGEMYRVTEKCQDGWFKGTSLRTAASGVFPGNYVTPVSRSVSSGLGMWGHYYWCCFSGNSVAYSIVYSSILEASQNAQCLSSHCHSVISFTLSLQQPQLICVTLVRQPLGWCGWWSPSSSLNQAKEISNIFTCGVKHLSLMYLNPLLHFTLVCVRSVQSCELSNANTIRLKPLILSSQGSRGINVVVVIYIVIFWFFLGGDFPALTANSK